MGKDGDTGTSFWKRLLRTIRNLIIAALIIVPCLYSVKIRLKLNDLDNSADSLRSALAASYRIIDSLKTIQDDEILTRDRLDDMIDNMHHTIGHRVVNWETGPQRRCSLSTQRSTPPSPERRYRRRWIWTIGLTL